MIINEYNRSDDARDGHLYNKSLVQVENDRDFQQLVQSNRVMSYCNNLSNNQMNCLCNYIQSNIKTQ